MLKKVDLVEMWKIPTSESEIFDRKKNIMGR
jgi:hypothetical protein